MIKTSCHGGTPCFNPRTHTGCDSRAWICWPRLVSFNPRTHTGCDPVSRQPIPGNLFQSTHPHGVRHNNKNKVICYRLFQSTHPHGVRHPHTLQTAAPKWFQSTHPHGVRLRTFTKHYRLFLVSIHAPTRGATRGQRQRVRHRQFQSTHPHGVRLATHCPCICKSWFQSTHPHGVRLRLLVFAHSAKRVSIHAPTRGATFYPVLNCRNTLVSIHAPTRGATAEIVCESIKRTFQSTHPHGVRLSWVPYISLTHIVSIHAPTRGAT